jgi:transposase
VTDVIIGIDPHKGSHTAVAVDRAENRLGQLRVRATPAQVDQLRRWAAAWPQRTWAVEGARGLGHLLAQQLLACGERVVDVQPKLAARVRLLNTGAVNKNDPNDARSVAVAALRSSHPREVPVEDQTAVLRLWARRYRDLGSARTQLVCRLHAVLCELVPGGFAKEISAGQAADVLSGLSPRDAVDTARLEFAEVLLEDLRRIDQQRRDTRRRLTRLVAASKTRLTDLYGVGPIIAATVLGYVGDISRFPTRDHFAAYNGTAPIEVSSGNRRIYRLSRRGNRQLNHAIHMAAVTQIRYPATIGRNYYDRKLAEGMAHKSALRALKRRISDALYAQLIVDQRPTAREADRDPGGQSGNDSASSAAGSHPEQPALRTSNSRADTHSRTSHAPTKPVLTPRPAPAKRRPSRSAAEVKLEPRPRPRRGRGQERA